MQEVLLGVYGLVLFVLSLYGFHGAYMAYLYYRLRRYREPQPPQLYRYPRVTVQLPIYNEVFVVERLIRSVCQLQYPRQQLEIQVLDDSTDETQGIAKRLVQEYRKRGINIQYYHRRCREGFKAGALKAGLAKASGEFIAIFDADFVPPPDFLLRTIPYFFLDERIGLVQTRWAHINESYSLLTRIQALILDYHFGVEQLVRSRAGLFLTFNGTAGVWRKAAIIDAGNWDGSTLAEDLDLSYRAQMRGWRCLFLPHITTPAELPVEVQAFKAQQFRWAKGSIQVARKLMPQLLHAPLPWKVRWQAIVHLTANLVYLLLPLIAVLCFPVVMLKKAFPIYDPVFVFFAVFIFALFGTFAAFACSQYTVARNKDEWQLRLWMFPLYLAGTMGLSINNARAVLEALFNRRSNFVRTPKYCIEHTQDDWRRRSRYAAQRLHWTAWIEVIFACYLLAGAALSAYWWEFAAVPFQLLFGFGYGYFALLSFQHHRQIQRLKHESLPPLVFARPESQQTRSVPTG